MNRYFSIITNQQYHEFDEEHLLEVVLLIEEAVGRLGTPDAVSAWLLTPVSSNGKMPIEYLATRQYAIFRGFLLGCRTGQERLRLLPPAKHPHLERSREEVEDARERLRPRMWRDEYDYDMGE